ncbi:hypothetical protein P7C70_g5503, partial [Phenoliferia sp. Uapishka_3]
MPGSSPFKTPGRPPLAFLGGLGLGAAGLRKVGAAGSTPGRIPGSVTPRPPPPPGAPAMTPAGTWQAAARKAPMNVAGRQMKQLQWDKLSPNAVASTVWGRNALDESEWSKKFKSEGIFDAMEDDFRMKQIVKRIVVNDAAKLKSVLTDDQRKHIQIALLKPGGVNKGGTAEDVGTSIKALVGRILALDDTLSETYLSALKTGLPGPEEVGKLNVYKEAPENELFELDSADRFLVECLRIYRVNERVKSMLYRCQFEDTIGSLEQDASKIYAAARSLLDAPHFEELLQLVLMLGNFMNATGHKGGAFGFKVTSINKLVDTKSATTSSKTLLHFTAATVTKMMPSTEAFLDELSKAADAYKADIGHVRAKVADLRASQKALDLELENYVEVPDLDPRDQFPKKMFRFAKVARERLDALGDLFTLAEKAVNDALAFYGEDNKSIPTTQEFFGIFKTFVTSYKKARDENMQTAARMAKSAEQAARKAEALAAAAASGPSDSLVDEAMRKLKEGTFVDSPRIARRDRRRNQSNAPTVVPARPSSPTEVEDMDIRQNAHALLEALRGEGFNGSSTPSTPPLPSASATSSRRSRTREGRRVGDSRPGSPNPGESAVPPVPTLRMVSTAVEEEAHEDGHEQEQEQELEQELELELELEQEQEQEQERDDATPNQS